MLDNDRTDLKWFAIRVTYSRELMVKAYLDAHGIESYIPMRFVQRRYGEKIRKIWAPIIHNLIFIHTTIALLKEIKSGTELPIRYIMERESRLPAVIPEKQMQDFMAVIATENEHVEIVAPEAFELTEGMPVRVTDGIFAGIEGRYIRHKGHSKVAITIGNVATALTAYIPRKFITAI